MRVTTETNITIHSQGQEAAEVTAAIVAAIMRDRGYTVDRIEKTNSGQSAVIKLNHTYERDERDPWTDVRTAKEATETDAPKAETGIKADDATKPAKQEECDCPSCQFRRALYKSIFGGEDPQATEAKAEDDGEVGITVHAIRIPLG